MATQHDPEMQTGGGNNDEGTATGQGGNVASRAEITAQTRQLLAPGPHGHQAPSTCTWVLPALHVAAMLLAVGALVPQVLFLKHRDWYHEYDNDRERGWDVATSPGLVLATSAFTFVLAAALLAWRLHRCLTRSAVRAPTAAPAAPACSPVAAPAVEAGLEAAMLALWIASVAAGAQTADKVHRNGPFPVWARLNGIMMAFAAASALTWGAALVCSLRALVRALVPGYGGSAVREARLDAEAGSRAGSRTGSDDGTPRGGGKQPSTPPLQPARLGLHAAAVLLAVGVIVAEGVFITHSAEYADSGMRLQGVIFAVDQALIMATAALTIALAGAMFLLHCQPGARHVWAAVATAVPSLAVCGAVVELLLSAMLLILWAVCVATSVKAMQRLQRSFWTSQVWEASNSAALALECVCVAVWAVGVGAAAVALVREAGPWWARRVAMARAAGTCVSRDVRMLLLVMGSLLAIGALTAEAVFITHPYSRDQPMTGSKPAVAPALVLATASAALVTAVVVLVGHGTVGGLRCSSGLDGIQPAVWPKQAQAAEALAAACVLGLWVASLVVSVKTADVLKQQPYRWVPEWSECNKAVLGLECASVLVWAAVLSLAVKPVGRAVGAAASEWMAAPGATGQLPTEAEQATDAGKPTVEPQAGASTSG